MKKVPSKFSEISLKKFCITSYDSFWSNHRSFTVKEFYWKFEKSHTKTPVLEFLFKKVAGLRACNFIEKDSNTLVYKLVYKLLYIYALVYKL